MGDLWRSVSGASTVCPLTPIRWRTALSIRVAPLALADRPARPGADLFGCGCDLGCVDGVMCVCIVGEQVDQEHVPRAWLGHIVTNKDYLRTLENGIRFGTLPLHLVTHTFALCQYVLCVHRQAHPAENIEEDLDASLEPVLLQQTFLVQGTRMIRWATTRSPTTPISASS